MDFFILVIFNIAATGTIGRRYPATNGYSLQKNLFKQAVKDSLSSLYKVIPPPVWDPGPYDSKFQYIVHIYSTPEKRLPCHPKDFLKIR
jgi:hypothetical protein